MDMEKIGRLIAVQRKALGYTQDDLGRILTVSGKAVSKWERGLCCPDVSLLSKLAVALKLNIAQLLAGEVKDLSVSSNLVSAGELRTAAPAADRGCIDLTHDGALGVVSPYLFGNNLEHTRSSVCGGLSAQMLKNRKFVGKPSVMEGVASGWYVIGERTYCAFSAPYTHHDGEHYHMHRKLECHAQMVSNFVADELCGIGQHELSLVGGRCYELVIVAKSAEDMELTVSLTDRWGKTAYAVAALQIEGNDCWKRYTALLKPLCTDADADLRITFEKKGCIHIGCVSLMDGDNFRGMRRDVIAAMKEMGITVLRWPGGNFAGEYNWFDGLMPVDERAPFESYLGLETQPHTLGYDFHEINTDDFIALCRMIGAEPFITINPAWGTPEESAAWVEYCNGDEHSVYGKLRAERGHPEPYHVMLWSLGNEFGYGHMEGDNSATGYSHLAREHALKMLEVAPSLTLCSSGPYPSREWAEYSAKPLSDISHFVSMHYYAHEPAYDAPTKLKEQYERCLSGVERARAKLYQMREQIGERGMISFDEWNVWYGWYRPSCVIDGIFSAMMMHMIIGEAQKCGIGIACQFEAVNESAIKVTPTGATLSATGQALSVMKVHSNGRLRYADGCAVITEKDGRVTATLVNPSFDESKCISLQCGDAEPSVAFYTPSSMLPHGRFVRSEIKPAHKGETIELELPPCSIAVLQYKKRPRHEFRVAAVCDQYGYPSCSLNIVSSVTLPMVRSSVLLHPSASKKRL